MDLGYIFNMILIIVSPPQQYSTITSRLICIKEIRGVRAILAWIHLLGMNILGMNISAT
jgi:hypothetical protein